MDALTADDPSVLGRYVLLGRLGNGGQGVVYLGRTAAGESVAVKALNPGLLADSEALRRFAGEVDHVRQVSSFCVAEVLDADLTGDRPLRRSPPSTPPGSSTAISNRTMSCSAGTARA
jgi:eukaryotic-like serine/threonine-protein kinase